MAFYKEDIVNVELQNGTIFRSFMSHAIGSGDALENRFGVRVFRNGEPEDIGGTVMGLFVRADGGTVTIASGTVSGNEAYITLPAACYAVEGNFSLAIKCIGSGVAGTLRIVDGVVSRTSTDAVVDPGTIIPSVEALIDAIEDAVATIPADYSSLWTSLAPTFSTGNAYSIGQYVTYDGKLWRFTTAHSAGAWNSSHATQVALGPDVSDLKNAIGEIPTGETVEGQIAETQANIDDLKNAISIENLSVTWHDGTFINENGRGESNSSYAYCDYVRIAPNAVFIFNSYFSSRARCVVYNANKTITTLYENTGTSEQFTLALPATKTVRYIRLSCKKAQKANAFIRAFVDPANVVVSMATRVEASNAYLTDCDDAQENSIYTIASTISNLPENKIGTLICLTGAFLNGLNGCAQIFISQDGMLYTRIHWGASGGTWQPWVKSASFSDAIVQIGTRQTSGGTIITDLDNATANRIYTITSPTGVSNLPNGNKIGTLITFNGATSYTAGQSQIFVSERGEVFSRIRWGANGGTWTSWQQLAGYAVHGYYSGVGLFERFGVVGDSFASGFICTASNPSGAAHYNMSWPQVLARMNGNTAVNYTKPGINTKEWLTETNYGLPKLLGDISLGHACGLYILCLGINDSNEARTPGGLTYLGTISDINDNDYTQNADSFYGNYGRIIQQIKAVSPNSRIVMSTFHRIPTEATSAGFVPFNEAIVEIANHFSIPCIKLVEDTFFTSGYYLGNMVGSHPTGPQYVGYAKAVERLLSCEITRNNDYFKGYIGV